MTNEVLQKTASDEQNVSSSNGLEPSLRFTGFYENWHEKYIKDVADVIGGGTPDTTKLEYWNGNIQWFTPTEIGHNKYVNKSKRTITEKGLKNSSAKLLPPKTILLTSRATIGECSIIEKECATNQGFQSLVPNSLINNEFCYYLINTKKKELLRKASGSTFLEISNSEIKQIKCKFPSLLEQQKIATFLSLMDTRIEKQRQLVESLKKYKRGLFLKLYNDSDKSIISFKNIYEMASEGGTPSTSDSENYENGKIPFIKIDDLNQHYLNFAKYFITEKGLKKSSAWIVPENSIIYSNGATIGACSINKIPVTTKQGILGIVPKSNFSVEFLYFFFTSSIFKQKIRAITTKGTMDCAYLKDINGIKISIPDFIAQQKIAKIMVDFENLIERTELSFIYLQNIKKALLQQMFI